MRYLLDTNILIFFLKNGESIAAKRLRRTPVSEFVTCSMVEAELYAAARRWEDPELRIAVIDGLLAPFRSLRFDASCAPAYALIRCELERSGQTISESALLIAATALTHNLTLVTHADERFRHVPGLRLEDWTVR